eukprot:177927_1
MDFVGKILQHQKNQENKKKKKQNKVKKKKKKTQKNGNEKEKERKPKSKNGKKKPAPIQPKAQKTKTPSSPPMQITIDSPKIKDTDMALTSSDDSDYYGSDYSSGSSIELTTPQYIPARVSLTGVFDINLARSEFYEKKVKQKRVKWGYSPHPSDDAVINKNRDSLTSNTSISPLSRADDSNIPKFKPSNSMGIILDDEDENQQDFQEEKVNNIKNTIGSNPLKRIDLALAQYYRYFNRDDYCDENGKGKFTIFCEENELMDEKKITQQFVENADTRSPQDCPYLAFDEAFPLILTQTLESNENEDEEERMKKQKEMRLIEIYNVMEYCYHHGQSPYF